MKLTRTELIAYLLGVRLLILHQLLNIKCYKPNKYELVDCNCEDKQIKEYKEIVNEFIKRYPKYSI